MITIKLNEATNGQLNWLVTKCELGRRLAEGEHVKPWVQDQILKGLHADPYTSDPLWAWEIAGRERISVHFCRDFKQRDHGPYVHAEMLTHLYHGYSRGHDEPFVAVARCYIASKLGDVAEVPEILAEVQEPQSLK